MKQRLPFESLKLHPTHLLDTNVFIEAEKHPDASAFGMQFWDWLIDQNKAGKIFSVIPVYNELTNTSKKVQDKLKDWAKKHASLFLAVDDEETQNNYSRVANWVYRNWIKTNKAKTKGRKLLEDPADGMLIATAMKYGATVVTQENGKHKIPDVCREFDVKCTNTFDFLKELKFTVKPS